MGCHKRGPWSQTEDLYLLELVHTQGAHNWVRISHLIATRSPKQCRERFHQNLKPTLNHDPITPEEGAVIERLVGEMGKRWAEIARRLRGRSDNAVKNWWNGGMNRRRRILGRRDGGGRGTGGEFREGAERLSYARPVMQPLPPLPPSPLQISSFADDRVEWPLISPAATDDSMCDSVGEVPSLISDASSTGSTSPSGTAAGTTTMNPSRSRPRPRPPPPRGVGGDPSVSPRSFDDVAPSVWAPEPRPRRVPMEQQRSKTAPSQRIRSFPDVMTPDGSSTTDPESPPRRGRIHPASYPRSTVSFKACTNRCLRRRHRSPGCRPRLLSRPLGPS